jgi:regulator of protease activity HflC (stomatin/prohibitin superfamily)
VRHSADDEIKFIGKVLVVVAIVVFILWFVISIPAWSVHQVPAGYVGIIYTFQDITGQTGSGLQFIPPWCGFRTESTQWQTFTSADLTQDIIQKIGGGEGTAVPKGYIGTFSSETQDVFTFCTLLFRVSATDIRNLLRTVGPNWRNIMIAPKFANFVKEETVKYNTVDIAPSREKIRLAIRDRLKPELAHFSIEAGDFLINNLDFRSEFKQAIENKQIATQNALREVANVEKQRQIGLQAKAMAIGVADSIRTMADANSYTNRVLRESLSDQVIAYTWAQKIPQNIQVALIPAGQGFLLDMKSMGLKGR